MQAAKEAGQTLINDPALRACGRLGWKELGNAFDPSRDGSISQMSHEYGMPFQGATPGEIARQKDGGVWGDQEHEGIEEQARDAGRDADTGREPRQQSRGR